MIGPVPPSDSEGAEPIGGGAVLFAETVRELRKRGFYLEIVDTTRRRSGKRRWNILRADLGTFARVMVQVARRARGCDVVFLCASSGRAWLGASCVWALGRALRRPIVLRFFGGDLAKVYGGHRSARRRWVDSTYMKSDLVYVETREVYERFRRLGPFRWFPNTRDLRCSRTRKRDKVENLVFFSRLNRQKGWVEAVEACESLAHAAVECHLDVYGPGMADTDYTVFDSRERVSYRGVLMPDEVPDMLANYDVLVYPSYWESEGYPGVVLEALQCGLPVITTRWKAIPEVVEHERSGLLVTPRSAAAVREAIDRLVKDPWLYRRLCAGAQRRGEFFRSGVWYDRMATDLRRLTGDPGRASE